MPSFEAVCILPGKDDGGGEPCCFLTKLSAISTIEFDGNEYAMKYLYVVKECGCDRAWRPMLTQCS